MFSWTKLNTTFDADPNVPEPSVLVEGCDVQVRFLLNSFIWGDVEHGDEAILYFRHAHMYRIGATNDEGFYLGQCRFSRTGIGWGNFYELHDSNWESTFPDDRVIVCPDESNDAALNHFLFYFRDETFECIAKTWEFERLAAGT